MSIQLGDVAIPFANESVLFVGAPGSGKSATAGNPGLMEVIKRGQPAIVFDAKGSRQDSITSQLHRLLREKAMALALSLLAETSPTVNWHNFIRSPTDASRSLQLANILEKNTAGFNPNKSGKGTF